MEMSAHNVVTFKTDEETRQLLELLQESEGRNRSDVIRRSVRLYAEAAGLVVAKRGPKPVKVASPSPKPRRAKR